ncbi:MAG TPA: SCP2 sterol-binding domain-containing protein [Acidimicrobiales bacterium]
MPEFLSDEWFAVVAKAADELPEVPGASLVMQHVVSGTPHGKVHAVVEVRDGRIVEARRGKRVDAECTLTWNHADAVAALRGELPIDVAFMRGDLKVDGDYVRLLFGLRPVLTSEAGRAFVASVLAATEL